MKRFLTLFLSCLMLIPLLYGCGLQGDDKGPIINVYIGDEIRNYDPQLMYNQASCVKFMSLIFDGLTRINAKGKLEYSLIKNVTILEDEEKQTYKMQIELIDTAWSDSRQLSADDVIFSWKRLLEPDFNSTACCMLYDIKNARKVREGDCTIDDLGLEALDTTLLQITFEGKIDYDRFLEYCASPALYPLREDIVSRYSDLDSGDYWAKKSSTIVCSGPFTLKNMDPDQAGLQLTLQRNYYYRDLSGGKDVAIDKYVKPYRLNMIFKLDSKGRQTAYDYDFNTGELTVEGTKVVLNERADKIQYLADVDMNTSGAVVQDIPNTYSMLLNCRNEVLSDPAVRQALSVSLDRNHIASLLKNAKPATGLVPYGVYYTDLGGKAYRDVAPDVYNTSADTALAKSLLSGKSKGEIKLTYYRAKEGAADVANYIKETWEALGFKVTLDPKGINLFARTILRNNVTLEYDYDIVLLDYQTLATNAFSLLAPYAVPFSGAGKDTKNNNFEDVPGITGYRNSAYDALIEEVYAADSRQAAAEKLTEAEALLAKDSPMITLVFNVDTYIYNKSLLSNIGTTIFGVRDFTNTRMKDYESYKPIETEEEEMSTDEAPQVQE